MADVTDAEAAPARAELIEAVMVPKPALDWLMGVDTDPAGLEFGEFSEDHPKPPGSFWWRKTFREICLYYSPRMLKAVLAASDAKDRIAELEAQLEGALKALLMVETAGLDMKARAEAAEAQLRLSSGTEDGVRALVEALGPYPEKLADEAEVISVTDVATSKIVMWAQDNGARLATIIREALALTRRT